MLGEWWADLRYRMKALVGRGRMESELDAEIAFHLEQEAAKLVRAGHSAEEARRRAKVAFGGVDLAKEASRDGRGLGVVEQLGRDLRFAFRGCRQRPGFAVAVVATLGLGIGANAAMFGVVDRMLFRAPAMLRDPGTVHRVRFTVTDDGRESTDDISVYTRYLSFRRTLTTVAATAGYAPRRLAVGVGAEAREMAVVAASASFFDFFDLQPTLGRLYRAAEDTTPVGAMVAVISHGHWQAGYGGRPDVVGQPIQIDRGVYTVIGVAPPGFTGLEVGEVPVAWIPITAYAGVFRNGASGYFTRYNWGWMRMIVRRGPDVPEAALAADLNRAAEQSYRELLAVHPNWAPFEAARPRASAIAVQVGRGPEASSQARVALWVTGVAVVVLLIASANVANLVFGRTLSRRREIAIRLAMGVSRRRLAAELMTECLLLAIAGGVVGLLIARAGGGLVAAIFDLTGPPLGLGDARTLLFTLVASTVAGLVTAIAPAWQAGRRDIASELRSGGRDIERRSRTRSGLLVAQAALSVVLLIGAGLFVRSLTKVQGVRLGFDVDGLLVVGREMRSVKLSDTASVQLTERLLDEAARLPGVERVARALTVPLYDTWRAGLWVAGIDSVERLGRFTLQAGSADFFATAGTRIVRGRGFTVEDRSDSRRVAVVSESMAAVLWPGRDAIGQCFRVDADTMPCTEVVGVAENLRQNSVAEPADHSYYLPIDQYHPEAAYLFLRAGGPARVAAEEVRRRLQPLMPGDSYLKVVPASEIVAPQLVSWRSGATMFTLFGAVALVLALVGLYSVMAYDVSRRRQEIGVRKALGAGTGELLTLIVKDGMRLGAFGVLVGAGLALVAGPWVEPLLFRQSPRDPMVFATVAATLLLAAASASVLPAIRAASLDPTLALRGD